MPVHDQDSQFKFLIACIKHCSSPGKVDFAAVANELGIVSKGAAAKRYERLMRAHGIQSGATLRAGTPGGSINNNIRANGSAATQRAPKKRKITSLGEGKDDEEDIKPKTERDLLIKEELGAEGSPGTVSAIAGDGEGDGEDEVVLLSANSNVDDALAAELSQDISPYSYHHTGYGYPLHASQMDTMALNGGTDWYQAAPGSEVLVWPGMLPAENQDDAHAV